MESDTNHDVVKMRVLGFFALILILIVGYRIPYTILYNMEEPPSDSTVTGWVNSIALYLGGADFRVGGFHEGYITHFLQF